METRNRNSFGEIEYIRRDSIYNPIEGKWEKRSNFNYQYEVEEKSFTESFKDAPALTTSMFKDGIPAREELKKKLDGFKGNLTQLGQKQAALFETQFDHQKAAHPQEMTDKPKSGMVKRLKDMKQEQDAKDREIYQQLYSEEKVEEIEEDEKSVWIFRLIVGIIGLLLIFFN